MFFVKGYLHNENRFGNSLNNKPILRRRYLGMVTCCDPRLLLFRLAIVAAAAAGIGAERYQPQIDPSSFQSKVDNPYFPLVPGTRFKYIETAGGETNDRETTVTSQTKMIMGVKCIVVHDLVTAKGKVKEDTYDWYAQDKQGTVWYFGEAAQEFKPGGRVSREGSWEGGVQGALPGIIMPGEAKPGKPYRQQYYANWAEDMGQIVALGETVTVPAGTFTNCLRTKEWSLLESGGEKKWYAPGIGFVRSEAIGGEVVTLISIKRP